MGEYSRWFRTSVEDKSRSVAGRFERRMSIRTPRRYRDTSMVSVHLIDRRFKDRVLEARYVRFKRQGLDAVILIGAQTGTVLTAIGMYLLCGDGFCADTHDENMLGGTIWQTYTDIMIIEYMLIIFLFWVVWGVVRYRRPPPYEEESQSTPCSPAATASRSTPQSPGGVLPGTAVAAAAATAAAGPEMSALGGASSTAIDRWPDVLILLLGCVYVFIIVLSPNRLLVIISGGEPWGEIIHEHVALVASRNMSTALDIGGCKGWYEGASYTAGASRSCYFRGYETFSSLALVLFMAWVAVYCRLTPALNLILAHLSAIWYVFARCFWGDLDSHTLQVWQDSCLLYACLLMLFGGARRFDLQLRKDFLENTNLLLQSAKDKQEINKMRRTTLAEMVTEEEREAIEMELGGLPAELRVDFEAVELGPIIGSGSYAEVHSGIFSGMPVAAKLLCRKHLTPRHLREFRQEGEMLAGLRHPSIVQMLGVAWRADGVPRVCLLLELCARGTLHDLLREQHARMLTWRTHKLPIATGVARALAYLHGLQPPIVHRDLKPANILVDDAYNARLADFGISREADNDATMTVQMGTPLYSAPEVLRRERYDEKVDVWSFGCCIEVMWTHEEVYAATTRRLADRLACSPNAECVRLVSEGVLWPNVPAASPVHAVVAACALQDLEQRPAFEAVVEMLEAVAEGGAVELQRCGPGVADPPARLLTPLESSESMVLDEPSPVTPGGRASALGGGTPQLSPSASAAAAIAQSSRSIRASCAARSSKWKNSRRGSDKSNVGGRGSVAERSSCGTRRSSTGSSAAAAAEATAAHAAAAKGHPTAGPATNVSVEVSLSRASNMLGSLKEMSREALSARSIPKGGSLPEGSGRRSGKERSAPTPFHKTLSGCAEAGASERSRKQGLSKSLPSSPLHKMVQRARPGRDGSARSLPTFSTTSS